MQTIFAALPKFECVRNNTEPAPKRRQRNLVVFVLCYHLIEPLLQLGTARDDFALMGNRRRNATCKRSLVKVCTRLFFGRLRNLALHSHLSFQRIPIKQECSVRIVKKLTAFAALVICEEDKTILIGSF